MVDVETDSHRLFIDNDPESAGIGRHPVELSGTESRCATSKAEPRRESVRAAVCKSVVISAHGETCWGADRDLDTPAIVNPCRTVSGTSHRGMFAWQ